MRSLWRMALPSDARVVMKKVRVLACADSGRDGLDGFDIRGAKAPVHFRTWSARPRSCPDSGLRRLEILLLRPRSHPDANLRNVTPFGLAGAEAPFIVGVVSARPRSCPDSGLRRLKILPLLSHPDVTHFLARFFPFRNIRSRSRIPENCRIYLPPRGY